MFMYRQILAVHTDAPSSGFLCCGCIELVIICGGDITCADRIRDGIVSACIIEELPDVC